VKPKIKSVEIHPQLSNKGHPVDGALVDAGSLWPNGFDPAALLSVVNGTAKTNSFRRKV
jgi:hypothetical protein